MLCRRRRVALLVVVVVVVVVVCSGCHYLYTYTYTHLSPPGTQPTRTSRRTPTETDIQQAAADQPSKITNLVLYDVSYTADVRHLVSAVTSMLYYRSSYVNISIVADDFGLHVCRTLFRSWQIPRANITLYNATATRTNWLTDTLHMTTRADHKTIPATVLMLSVRSPVEFIGDIAKVNTTRIRLLPGKELNWLAVPVPVSCKTSKRRVCTRHRILQMLNPDDVEKNGNGRENELSLTDSPNLGRSKSLPVCGDAYLQNQGPHHVTQLYFMVTSTTGEEERVHITTRHDGYRVVSDNTTVDVTLVTAFTMLNFGDLVYQVLYWGGPVVAVLYGTPHDIQSLRSKVMTSQIYHHNITYHVVYQQQSELPLRYLLNVGINSSTTMYTYITDVHCMTALHAYHHIIQLITAWRDQYPAPANSKHVFGLATFESSEQRDRLLNALNDKSRVIQSVEQGVTHGRWPFRADDKSYTHWLAAHQIYEVDYQHQWPPCFILSTNHILSYDEMLDVYETSKKTSRDVTLNTPLFHKQGYKVLMLPDVYAIRAAGVDRKID